MRLDVAFWLLDSDGGYRCPLPDVQGWKLSPIAGAPGAVQLDYPVTGRNFTALREHHDADRDAQVAIWIDGRDDGSLRALLVAEDADDVDDAAVWTFTGHFTEVRTEEAVITPRTEVVVPPGGEVPTEDLAAFRIYSATAGTIMRTLMQEAQAAGELADLTYAFTGTADSNGVPWSKVITLKFAPGVTFLKVLEALDEYQLCEWAVVDGELELYEPGTRGVDRTLGADPVILRRGRDMTDSPRKRTIRGAPTDLVVAGAEGLYVRVVDETARARRGRVITAYASAGSLNDEGSLLAYGQTKLAQLVHGTMEVTHGLALGDEGPVPLLDYGVSDWLWSDTGRPELERLQVAQITIAGDESGEITGSVSLNDLIASRQAELARRISGIEGGSTITGTSQARPVPEGPDTTVPSAPEGLVLDSVAYTLDNGDQLAAVTVAWAAVTTNTDQTSIDDLSHYQLRWRYLDIGSAEDYHQPPITPDTAQTFSGVRVGELVGVQVAAVDRAGNTSAWSLEYETVTQTDDTPPPAPSALVVTPRFGQVLVETDGLGAQGEPMPSDLEFLEVHSATTDNFTPVPATLFDLLVRGTRATMWTITSEDEYGVTRFFRAVAVDRQGNRSDPSPVSSVVPERAGDGDLAGLNVGKLESGALSAIIALLGEIRTANPPDARVIVNSTGLYKYDAENDLRIVISETDALWDGRIRTGLSGESRIEMGNSFYGRDNLVTYDNGTVGLVLIGQIYNDADGAPLGNGILVQEPSRRDVFRVYATGSQAGRMWFMGRRAYLAATNGDTDSTRNGGFIILGHNLDDEETYFGRTLPDGRESFHWINSSGTHVFTIDNSRYAEVNTNGLITPRVRSYHPLGNAVLATQRGDDIMFYWNNGLHIGLAGSGAFIKSFVIDHPTDPDRWLVHACTESPQAGVEYWGEVDVVDHEAVVELPAYFEALTRAEGRQVQVSVVLPDDAEHVDPIPAPAGPVGAAAEQWPPPPTPGVPEWGRIPQVAASRPREGRFRISCSAPTARVAWLVKAVRADVEQFDVEPLRADYDAHGDGPYRYLTPREA